MKPVRFVMSALALAMAMPAFADDPAPAPAPADPLSFNVSLTTDYRYRGISQTRLKPALQGGADYAFDSGFYVGTWLSTIKWIKDAGGDAPVEWDIYGGYKTEIAKGISIDVGLLQYEYVNNKLHPSANTLEAYAAVTVGLVTAKYSASTTNLFGFADSKKSGYFDLSAALDLGEGFTLTPHYGHQKVKNLSAASYSDYSLTLNKDMFGVTWGAAVVGTNAKGYYSPNGKDLGKTAAIISVKKTF